MVGRWTEHLLVRCAWRGRIAGACTLVWPAAVLLWALSGSLPASSQSSQSPTSFGLDLLRGAISDDPSKGGGVGSAPRAGADPAAKSGPGQANAQVTLVAVMTAEEGQRVESGLVWRVFSPRASPTGQARLVTTSREASPTVRLPAGDYIVNVTYGRAHTTRRIKVTGTGQPPEVFNLNVGLLKVTALLATGGQAPPTNIVFDIYSDERDRFGQRTKVIASARPGPLFRLNSGLYQIVSLYGDANAMVYADFTVEPGKQTEATVIHAFARVTFKLVTRPGGDAIADTQWSLANRQGEVVKESAGALPTHILAPGVYTVTARSQGRQFRRSFTVKQGEVAQVEVLVQ